jgi:hypothetical protein
MQCNATNNEGVQQLFGMRVVVGCIIIQPKSFQFFPRLSLFWMDKGACYPNAKKLACNFFLARKKKPHSKLPASFKGQKLAHKKIVAHKLLGNFCSFFTRSSINNINQSIDINTLFETRPWTLRILHRT